LNLVVLIRVNHERHVVSGMLVCILSVSVHSCTNFCADTVSFSIWILSFVVYIYVWHETLFFLRFFHPLFSQQSLTPCNLVDVNGHFVGTYCLHHQSQSKPSKVGLFFNPEDKVNIIFWNISVNFCRLYSVTSQKIIPFIATVVRT
jgi:hypothetical protein